MIYELFIYLLFYLFIYYYFKILKMKLAAVLQPADCSVSYLEGSSIFQTYMVGDRELPTSNHSNCEWLGRIAINILCSTHC